MLVCWLADIKTKEIVVQHNTDPPPPSPIKVVFQSQLQNKNGALQTQWSFCDSEICAVAYLHRNFVLVALKRSSAICRQFIKFQGSEVGR
jgi:hypothetical protein